MNIALIVFAQITTGLYSTRVARAARRYPHHAKNFDETAVAADVSVVEEMQKSLPHKIGLLHRINVVRLNIGFQDDVSGR